VCGRPQSSGDRWSRAPPLPARRTVLRTCSQESRPPRTPNWRQAENQIISRSALTYLAKHIYITICICLVARNEYVQQTTRHIHAIYTHITHAREIQSLVCVGVYQRRSSKAVIGLFCCEDCRRRALHFTRPQRRGLTKCLWWKWNCLPKTLSLDVAYCETYFSPSRG
jgi:hypothetical protein